MSSFIVYMASALTVLSWAQVEGRPLESGMPGLDGSRGKGNGVVSEAWYEDDQRDRSQINKVVHQGTVVSGEATNHSVYLAVDFTAEVWKLPLPRFPE